jgi:hypothetical protein
MSDSREPFDFRACLMVLKSTGKKASTLRELKACIEKASDGCLFHHTYQYFLKGHALEYTNDFAHWAGESLEERALAEALSVIDPYDFQSVAELRLALLNAIDGYLRQFPEPRRVIAGDEFFFNETATLVFPIGLRARNLAEFLSAIKYIDPAAIYYHFFEARMRTGDGDERGDDFSRWIDALGHPDLARRLRAIDPFVHNLEDIRRSIAEAVEETVRKEMEVMEP